MPDYQEMYPVLCRAVDEVIDPLEEIPLAVPSAAILRRVLPEAEEVYLQNALLPECAPGSRVIRLRREEAPEENG